MNRKLKYDYFEFKKVYKEQKGNISQMAMILSKERPTIRNWIEKMNRDDELIGCFYGDRDKVIEQLEKELTDAYADERFHLERIEELKSGVIYSSNKGDEFVKQLGKYKKEETRQEKTDALFRHRGAKMSNGKTYYITVEGSEIV